MEPRSTPQSIARLRRRDRLSVRQARWALLVAVTLGIAFSVAQLATDLSQEKDRLETTSQQFLEILDQPASFAALNRDKAYAKELLVGYFSYQAVYRAELLDASGQVLAAQEGALQQGPWREVVDGLFGPFRKFSKELTYQTAPDNLMDMAEIKQVGKLQVWVDSYPTGIAFLRRAALVLLGGVVRNLVLAAVLLWGFNRFLTQPFVNLANQLAAMNPLRPEDKELDVPQGHERDEFSLLVERINGLLGAIAGHFNERIRQEREAERLEVELVEQQKREQEMRAYQAQLEETNVELEQLLAELKNTQEALIESRTLASLGGLVAGVAHELNTPVGIGVTGASSILSRIKNLQASYQKGEVSEEEFEDYLTKNREMAEILLANLERASELIQGFKRVAVDQTRFELQRFDLCDYLRATLRSLEPEMKSFRPKIAVDCPEELELTGYPGALGQVVVNLVQNSLRHGFPGRPTPHRIDVSVRQVRQLVEITYQDNGKGIDTKNLAHVFEPFFTTSGGQGGTGLGLHILYNLVRAKMHGEIQVQSDPGEGARFIIRFPQTIEAES